MKPISPEFFAHLSGEVTSFCLCWLLKPQNAPVMGFTDHDENITFLDVVCKADTSLDVSNIESTLGLNVDNQEVVGALQDDAISNTQIEEGFFDAAVVEQYLVNWSEPSQHLLESRFVVGEVTRGDGVFKVELRSMSSHLDQSKGYHFVRHCQADLGDSRCGVDLTQNQHNGAGSVEQVRSPITLEVNLTGEPIIPSFRGGFLAWGSGANTGLKVEIADFKHQGNHAVLQLWKPMPHVPVGGDLFSITVGCDKQFSTCKTTFQNEMNFRGFPHMPGDDFASNYASNSSRMDGGALIK